MSYRRTEDGAVPVLFCERQKRWLPIEEHMQCEYCVAEVFDQEGDPVSFICLHTGERRCFQTDWVDEAELGVGG